MALRRLPGCFACHLAKRSSGVIRVRCWRRHCWAAYAAIAISGTYSAILAINHGSQFPPDIATQPPIIPGVLATIVPTTIAMLRLRLALTRRSAVGESGLSCRPSRSMNFLSFAVTELPYYTYMPIAVIMPMLSPFKMV